MLSDTQLEWFSMISEKDLSDIFSRVREERLLSLNVGSANYEQGRFVQDEVAALHRLEKRFLDFKKDFVKKDNQK